MNRFGLAVVLLVCLTNSISAQLEPKELVNARRLFSKAIRDKGWMSPQDDALNTYVDSVTAIACQYIVDNSLDEYSVPSNSFLGVISEGCISGYTVLQRNGDASEALTATDVTITANIDIVSTVANFTWSTNFNNTPQSGYAECAGQPITFSTNLQGPVDESSLSTILSVQSTDVVNIGAIEVIVYGTEDETLISFLQTYFVDYVEVFVPVIVDNNIKAALDNTLSNDPYPLV